MAAKRSTPASGTDALIGQTIGSHYTLQRFLGRGARGVSFLATHRTLHRTVIIQLLSAGWADEKAAVARFEEKAKALAQLEHPNIAAVHDSGHDPGRVWIAVEFVEGEPLSEYIRRRGRLQLEAFVPVAAQILKGLGGAHARQVIHRDLKASNVLLVEEQGRANYVKLLELGIQALLDGPPDADEEAPPVGEPAYLAPEVIMNKPADARADVYAVGVLFYQMLAGRLPFEGESAKDVLHKQVNDKPTPLGQVLPQGHNVPEGLIELIHDCLAKNPDNRPNDANEIVERMIDCVPATMFRLPVASPRFKSAASMAGDADAPARARAASLAAAVEASGPRPVAPMAPIEPEAATQPEARTGSGGGGLVLALLAVVAIGVGVYVWMQSQGPAQPRVGPVPVAGQPSPQTAAALAKAQEFERAGKLHEALAAYEVVLATLDPDNAAAKDRVAALKAMIEKEPKVEAPPDAKVEAPPDTKVEAPPDTKVDAPPDTKVDAPPDTKVETPPQPATIKIRIEANARGAELFVGEVNKGKLPLDLDLPPGRHEVILKARGFEDLPQTIEASASGEKVVKAKMVRKVGAGGINRDEENKASEELDPESHPGAKVEVPIKK